MFRLFPVFVVFFSPTVFLSAQWLHLNFLLFEPVIAAPQLLVLSLAATQHDFSILPDLPPATATRCTSSYISILLFSNKTQESEAGMKTY